VFISPPWGISKVFSTWTFYGVRLAASSPTSNLEDQVIPFHLGHHLWPVQHGRSYQELCYHQHSSQDPLTMQALPLGQSKENNGGPTIRYVCPAFQVKFSGLKCSHCTCRYQHKKMKDTIFLLLVIFFIHNKCAKFHWNLRCSCHLQCVLKWTEWSYWFIVLLQKFMMSQLSTSLMCSFLIIMIKVCASTNLHHKIRSCHNYDCEDCYVAVCDAM